MASGTSVKSKIKMTITTCSSILLFAALIPSKRDVGWMRLSWTSSTQKILKAWNHWLTAALKVNNVFSQRYWTPLTYIESAGFKGQARVILPTVSSCYECSLDMLNKPTAFPICTIANTPRLPEHCIEWASVLEWPRVWKGYPFNFSQCCYFILSVL